MDRHSELKSFSAATAEALVRGEGSLEFARRLGLLGEQNGHSPGFPPGWVGIWQPKTEDGQRVFVRSQTRMEEWTYWAELQKFPAKSDRKRVVYLGESVARGYFYDPKFTPAAVLEQFLADVPGGCEVLDLARSNLNTRHLAELVESAAAASPDALVIFAGNNWSFEVRQLAAWPDREVGAAILRDEGVAGLKAYVDNQLKNTIERIVSPSIEKIAREIPVVIMIPEFNLVDWSFGGNVDAPWLPGRGNERWLRCYREAEEALRQGRVAEAEALAGEMIALDGGAAAGGFLLLAQCKRRQGRADEVRALLEKARDAHSWEITWRISVQPPKPLAYVQDLLRQMSSVPNVTVVDIPRVLGEWLYGEAPGRRLFLDYCHLTTEGIRVAMAAAAEALSPILGGPQADFWELATAPVAPDPGTEGEARFAAAIHNAHWGQSYDVVLHHCREALIASPDMAEPMHQFAELQARQAPPWACSAAERLVASMPSGPLRRYLATYMVHSQGKFLDEQLVEAILTALEEAGQPRRERIEALRRGEQGVRAGRPLNLLSVYHQPSWTNRDWMTEWSAYHFFRAHAPVSRFVFESVAAQPLHLRMVCRRLVDAEACEVRFNGDSVGTLAVGESWQTWSTELANVREGLNELEVHWPVRTLAGEEGLRLAAADFENNFNFDLLPIFGEISTLTVAVAGDRS